MNRVLFVNLLIALAPNVHFLRILHKLVAEIRVGDADQRPARSQVDRPFRLTMPYSVTM